MQEFFKLRIVKFSLLLISVAFTLSSCCKRPLWGRLQALCYSDLASSRIGAPDPFKNAYTGQQITLSWKVSKHYKNLELYLTFINGLHNQERYKLPVDDYKGSFSFKVVNYNYYCRRGILTYKAELFSDGKLVAFFAPRTWVEFIEFD
jgi:hypothetical protein